MIKAWSRTGGFLTRGARALAALGLLVLATASSVAAAVDITQVSVANISTGGFTAVWRTSEAGVPGLDVFADAAGTTSLAGSVRVEFSPLGVGDVTAGSTFASRAVRRALQDVMASRLVVVVRVNGLAPGATVYFRPRTFDVGGADNGSGVVPLTEVTTADATDFVLDNRLLAVQFPGFASEGTVALLHGPAGIGSLTAVVGDGDDADVAIFPLGNLIDTTTGTSADFAAATNFTISVLGVGAPAGTFPHTVDFGTTFAVGSYELFVASTASPAPVITAHPTDVTLLVGETAQFTVAASGDPAPGYQWQRQAAGSGTWVNVTNDATYSGATTAMLSVANATQAMSGDQFRAVASNGILPDATSTAATLVVNLGSSSIGLSGLAHTYDGTPKSATVTTNPAGLTFTVTYDGGATLPVNAGSYAVVATITEAGYSGTASGTLTIAKANQTITFGAPADKTLGDAPFAVTATASSNLPVAFSIISGPATIAGDTITLTGAGSVMVRATQVGDTNFNAAPVVERSFTVAKGNAVVTLGSLDQLYTGTPRAATATTDPAGLTVTFTYNGSSAAPTAAGTYDVVATASDANYAGSASGTLTVTKADQTITFATLPDQVFGTPPFAVGATASSSLAVTFSIVSGPATIAGNTVTLTGAGVVTVRASQPGGTNFNAAPDVERSFTVADSTVEVTLGNLTQVYTSTPRVATATTNPAGLTVTFTYDGSGSAPTEVGTYAVVATVADAIYHGTAAGTLTITPAPLIARADPKAKVQGAANPALTITYLGFLGGQTAAVLDSLPVASTTALVDSPAGAYPITLSGGSDDNYAITLQDGTLTITPTGDTAPTINLHPQSQSITVGNPLSLLVAASGTDPLAYQWYWNGVPLTGATAATYEIASTVLANAGSYSVVVSNGVGAVTSQLATITIVPPPNVPTIVDEPDDVTVRRLGRTIFRVRAVGDAPLTYQWRKGGVPIGGATSDRFEIDHTLLTDAGLYSVVVTNPAGTDTSRDARLTVAGRSWRGTYFGIFGNNGGTCAFYIRDDNTGVFCGFARGSNIPLFSRDCRVDDNGRFFFTSGPRSVLPSGVAAVEPLYDFDLQIDDTGNVTGTVTGLNLTVEAALSPETGITSDLAGFYESGAVNSGDVSYTILGSDGEAYVVTIVGATVDAGQGAVDTAGNVTVVTEGNTLVSGTLNPGSGTITSTVTPVGGAAVSLVGANNDVREDVEKLVNISTRGPTGTGGNVVIAGFVIAGTEPKTVLIRGVGPTLGSLGVPGTIPAVAMRLYTNSNEVARSGDWGAAENAAAIEAAAARVSAFPLIPFGRDSAMLLTLQPGQYTAHLYGPDGETGVSLVEVYDATEGPIAPSQRVINISTRGLVGTADDVQIAGFVIAGSLPRRVLIRGVGPGLAPYLGTGFLADPTITLYDVAGNAIVGNDDWGTGNVPLIQEVDTGVGAFPLTPDSKDAVLLLHLQPGVYTVHVRGVGGETGIALVEVYDAP